MTDEERAEEWLAARYLKGMGVIKPCKEAFLAGLKAGKDMAETDLATVAYMQGAESGYNKANEWHYPSKGEYPKECENVLCYCKCRTEIKFYCVGHTVIGGDNKIRWWSGDRSEKLKVYAWKEITPPKEIKGE